MEIIEHVENWMLTLWMLNDERGIKYEIYSKSTKMEKCVVNLPIISSLIRVSNLLINLLNMEWLNVIIIWSNFHFMSFRRFSYIKYFNEQWALQPIQPNHFPFSLPLVHPWHIIIIFICIIFESHMRCMRASVVGSNYTYQLVNKKQLHKI